MGGGKVAGVRENARQVKAAWWAWLLLATCAGLMLARNLPWHLDDKDQAKQAFIAVEMLRDGGGTWWFQHTPDREVATKPPLMGWLNAGLHRLGLPWNFSWRLPGFLACLAMLAVLWRRGWSLATEGGGARGGNATTGATDRMSPSPWLALVPALCFGANLLTPRVALLVRTDALLAGCVAWAAVAVFDRLCAAEDEGPAPGSPVQARPRGRDATLAVAVALTLAALLKGPIAWVFLLPGALAYGGLRRLRPWRQIPPLPVRWWAWVLPLLPFVAWSLAAIRFQPGFYEQVVQREFLGRFEGGENAPHHVQNPLYYLLQLAKAFAPWLLGGLALLALDRSAWARALGKPALLWLFVAAAMALGVMSMIPSKRLDRVFPLVVPAALFAGGLAAQVRHPRRNALLGATALLAVLGYSAYTAVEVAGRYRRDEAAFTRAVRHELPLQLAELGIDPARGEVASLERNAEALFVWQPQIRLLGGGGVGRAASAQGVRAVLLRARDRSRLREAFPAARRVGEIPPPAESSKPLELWVIP